MADTNAQPFVGEDGVETLRLGLAELLYALLIADNETAATSFGKLGLPAAILTDRVNAAGRSSLYARGMFSLGETDDDFVPSLELAAIGFAGGKADAWITYGASKGEQELFTMLGITALDSGILISQGELDTFEVGPLPSGPELLEFFWMTLEAQWEEFPGSVAYFGVERNDGSPQKTIFVREAKNPLPGGEDSYDIAVGEGADKQPPILPGAKTADEVDAILADAFGVDLDDAIAD